MTEEFQVLQDITAKLAAGNLAYMMTGSMALALYGTPRMTRDIDIVIDLQESQISSFVKLFQNEYYIAEESVRQAVVRKGVFNLIHNESILKIDFIVRKNTVFRELEFQRRQVQQFENFTYSVVSIEDLILSKLVWSKDSHSEMQYNDIRQLLLTETADLSYLKLWAQELDVADELERILANG